MSNPLTTRPKVRSRPHHHMDFMEIEVILCAARHNPLHFVCFQFPKKNRTSVPCYLKKLKTLSKSCYSGLPFWYGTGRTSFLVPILSNSEKTMRVKWGKTGEALFPSFIRVVYERNARWGPRKLGLIFWFFISSHEWKTKMFSSMFLEKRQTSNKKPFLTSDFRKTWAKQVVVFSYFGNKTLYFGKTSRALGQCPVFGPIK